MFVVEVVIGCSLRHLVIQQETASSLTYCCWAKSRKPPELSEAPVHIWNIMINNLSTGLPDISGCLSWTIRQYGSALVSTTIWPDGHQISFILGVSHECLPFSKFDHQNKSSQLVCLQQVFRYLRETVPCLLHPNFNRCNLHFRVT